MYYHVRSIVYTPTSARYVNIVRVRGRMVYYVFQLQCVVIQLTHAHSDRGELAPPSVVVTVAGTVGGHRLPALKVSAVFSSSESRCDCRGA